MKRLISLLLSLVIICSFGCTVVNAQSEQISPRYNNMAYTDTNFNIDSNGNATVYAGYTGYSGITTGARITILLEKKNLIFFWKDIEEWVITSNDYHGSFTRSCAVSSGDYRVTITFEISGNGGATDVYEVELKDSY